MRMNLQRWGVLGGLVLVLAAANVGVWQRETVLHEGQPLYLELAPVDPRSLMQGDYMALNYAVAAKLAPPLGERERQAREGTVILKRDERGVGQFVRVDAGSPPAADELGLRYRVRDRRVRLVTNAWFFQEGQGHVFGGARYGEFRVGRDGEALLVALRDKDLKVLGTRTSP